MKLMKEEDDEKYKRHFSKFIENGIAPDSVKLWNIDFRATYSNKYLLFQIEGMYKKAHAAIRAKPEAVEKKEKPKTEAKPKR